MFRARIVFNEGFPDIWPRVKFATPLSHPHITKTGGYPFYKVRRIEDIRSHLTELYQLFANDVDPDPGTHVNREAAELCFGNKDQRRECAFIGFSVAARA
jgi:ubiquitin-conjugating enzyme E2 Z